MHVDNQGHQRRNDVQTNEQQNGSSSNSRDDAVQEAMRQWIFNLIVAGFKGLGNATENSDDKGGKNVSDAGPASMEELTAMAGGATASADATMAEGLNILEQLFGQEVNPDTSVYFDEGMHDPDLINLFGGQLPVSGPAPNPSAGATGDRGEPDAVIGGGATPSNGAEETEETPPPMTTGEQKAVFGSESIYGLAALVLLTTMENKRNIISNRLSQIEETNNRVQEITNKISELKAAKSGLENEGDKTNVDISALETVANNNLDPMGSLDEEGTEKFFNELGLDGDQIDKISSGTSETKEIELTKAQIDAVIEKLTSQSEALSTQNQTRNIKLQQQISELQVTTQMTSAIIDQIKTLGSGIAQRI